MVDKLWRRGPDISRKKIIPSAVATIVFGLMLACSNGGSGDVSAVDTATPNPDSSSTQPLTCVLSYPGATVIGIAGGPGVYVEIDKGDDGTIDYRGPAVNAGGLQYNEGPEGLDGKSIWKRPIQDKVCYK